MDGRSGGVAMISVVQREVPGAMFRDTLLVSALSSAKWHLRNARAELMDFLGYRKSVLLQEIYPIKVGFQSRRMLTVCERESHDVFASWLSDNSNVLDVGANLGRYSLYAALRGGSHSKVVAVEADPLAYRSLRRNLKLNRCQDNVITVQRAAWDKKERLTFHINRAGRSSVACGWGSHERTVQAAGCPLDDISAKEKFVPDIVKIDVEGAEFKALLGMKKLLRSARPKVLLELHPAAMEALGNDVDQLMTFLTRLSYEVLALDSTPVVDIEEYLLKSKTVQALPSEVAQQACW